MDRRKDIVEAATDLFCADGFEKTPTSAVCARAGVSKGLLFHHFRNKQSLLRAVFEHITSIIEDTSESAEPGGTALERLARLMDAIFLGMSRPEHADLYRFNFAVMTQPSTRAILEDLIDERSEMLRRSVEPIFAELSDQPSVWSHTFVAEIDGIAMNHLFFGPSFPLEGVRQNLLELYQSRFS